MLEIDFIEKYKKQKPILLIDDLLSELDQEHKDLLLKKIENYQSFITSIRKDYHNKGKLIELKKI
jgi:DNA replication and repair protein RecF